MHVFIYSPKLLILAYFVHTAISTAYEYLRSQNLIILPSIRTLRKVTRKVNADGDGLHNYNHLTCSLRFNNLNEYQRHVALVIVAKRVEIAAGKTVGLTKDTSAAQTALCFMIKSLSCKYNDTIGIFPMNALTANELHQWYVRIMDLVLKIGFYVCTIILDNSHVNRKFFITNLCDGKLSTHTNSPWTNDKLFLIFDPTHNWKNLYNNFEKRGVYECPSMPLHFESTSAKFSDIEEVDLYKIEKKQTTKYSPQVV